MKRCRGLNSSSSTFVLGENSYKIPILLGSPDSAHSFRVDGISRYFSLEGGTMFFMRRYTAV